MFLALLMSIAVQGVVTTDNGVPVPGVTMTLLQGPKPLVVVTDANGKFKFPNVAELPYVVRAELAGFQTVDLKGFGDAPLKFHLKPRVIEMVLA